MWLQSSAWINVGHSWAGRRSIFRPLINIFLTLSCGRWVVIDALALVPVLNFFRWTGFVRLAALLSWSPWVHSSVFRAVALVGFFYLVELVGSLLISSIFDERLKASWASQLGVGRENVDHLLVPFLVGIDGSLSLNLIVVFVISLNAFLLVVNSADLIVMDVLSLCRHADPLFFSILCLVVQSAEIFEQRVVACPSSLGGLVILGAALPLCVKGRLNLWIAIGLRFNRWLLHLARVPLKGTFLISNNWVLTLKIFAIFWIWEVGPSSLLRLAYPLNIVTLLYLFGMNPLYQSGLQALPRLVVSHWTVTGSVLIARIILVGGIGWY